MKDFESYIVGQHYPVSLSEAPSLLCAQPPSLANQSIVNLG